MTFDEYQTESRKTALYPNAGNNYIYPTLGLAGEAGEIPNKVKKIQRDDDGVVTDQRRADIAKEMGDVLWYLANLATELDLKLEDVASNNLEKLFSRMDRGAIVGDGDNR